MKVVDGDAVMYTYNCIFDTAGDVGIFYDGCYVDKGESHLEAERGYYYTKTHNLVAVDNVEMRDEKYLMTGDSVIFNTQTEDAQYFLNTNIWNDKDEYLFANEGRYTKAQDLHHLTRDAYLLSEEREVWSDTIEYYRTEGHIIGRGNIQMDDTTQKILGFADYGEWWDDLDNALFTRRPSMINYNPDEPDSLFFCADTLWLYTIPVLPPAADSVAVASSHEEEVARGEKSDMQEQEVASDKPMEESVEESVEESIEMASSEEEPEQKKVKDEVKPSSVDAKGGATASDMGLSKGGDEKRRRHTEHKDKKEQSVDALHEDAQMRDTSDVADHTAPIADSVAVDTTALDVADTFATDTIAADTIAADTLIADTLAQDSVKVLTPKQMRYRARL